MGAWSGRAGNGPRFSAMATAMERDSIPWRAMVRLDEADAIEPGEADGEPARKKRARRRTRAAALVGWTLRDATGVLDPWTSRRADEIALAALERADLAVLRPGWRRPAPVEDLARPSNRELVGWASMLDATLVGESGTRPPARAQVLARGPAAIIDRATSRALSRAARDLRAAFPMPVPMPTSKARRVEVAAGVRARRDAHRVEFERAALARLEREGVTMRDARGRRYTVTMADLAARLDGETFVRSSGVGIGIDRDHRGRDSELRESDRARWEASPILPRGAWSD